MGSGTTVARRNVSGPFKPTLFAVLFIVFLVLSVLRAFDWNPASFLHVGEDAPEIVVYVEDRLGNIPTFGGLGHDGKYFFIQAHDPLLANPETHAAVIDRAAYRYQRVLYAVLAAPGLAAGESGLAWWLLILNVAAVGLGTLATARLAVAFGASPWWGLAFGMNPGIIFEVMVDGAGVLALAFALIGLLMVVRERWWAAALFFVMAGLTREVMILMAVGTAVAVWKRSRTHSVALAMAPVASVALWAVFVRVRLGVGLLEAQSVEIGPPFLGLISSVGKWMENPGVDLVVGFAMVAICLMVLRRLIAERSLVTLAVVGFVALAILLTDNVWLHYFDITRALAPLVTGFALVVASDTRARTRLVNEDRNIR